MYPRNIQQFKLDLTGEDPDNFIQSEYHNRTDIKQETIFITRAGPFYAKSLVVTDMSGTPYIEDEDYELFGIASELTAFAKNKEVSTMVKIINPKITEWYFDYQVVGHFSYLNQQLLNLIDGAINDQRPVWYDDIKNKPKWFNPKLHQHDIRYEIICFKALVDCLEQVRVYKKDIPNRNVISIEQFRDVILKRVEIYEEQLLEIIRQHDNANIAPFTNAHGLTADQVGLGKVDNFGTATLLDVLDGFRKDLHVTADNLKKAVDKVSKGSENLVKMGSIPVIRYGSNSFIPSPIQGSFEGMGGNDFYVGVNIESNEDAVMICPRNDGKTPSAALYFMTNTDSKNNYPPSSWLFTGFKYTHQTADAAGVTLMRIIRGSDGKFMIVGGPDAAGKTTWFYVLTEGTFDATRHKLLRVPDEVNITNASYICTAGYPDRILLFTRTDFSGVWADKETWNQALDLPDYSQRWDNSSTGAVVNSSFAGFKIWEYKISDGKWRQATLHYQQPGYTNTIVAKIYVPFRMEVKAVGGDYQRGDGASYKYGIHAFEYIYEKLITKWDLRTWHDSVLALYNAEKDQIYCKYLYCSYGQDTRIATFEGGTNSLNFIMKNRRIVDGVLHYDIEGRRSLDVRYTLKTSITNAKVNVASHMVDGVVSPHAEWIPTGYTGIRTVAWLGTKRMFTIGSSNHGSYPATLSSNDLSGLPSVENLTLFVDDRLNANLNGVSIQGSVTTYNEENPIRMAMGAHSVFWMQLDPDDPSTFGCVCYCTIKTTSEIKDDPTVCQGLWFRKQEALDAKGYPIEPTKQFELYEASNGKPGKKTLGYPLNNTVYPFIGDPYMCYNTVIFADVPNNRKTQYAKHLLGHHAFKGNSGTVNNNTANTKVAMECRVVPIGEGYGVEVTKYCEFKDAIVNILIPHLEKEMKKLDPAHEYSFANALALHRMTFANAIGTKRKNLMIFSTTAFWTDIVNTKAVLVNVAFDVSGGTLEEDTIINPTVTVVGDVVYINQTNPKVTRIEDYLKAGTGFPRSRAVNVTQPRDLIKQQKNGLTHVNMQFPHYVEVVGNNSYPGISMLVSEEGIQGIRILSQYWTAGEYQMFHHPYYGLMDRTSHSWSGKTVNRIDTGPSQIGWPYTIEMEKITDLVSTYQTAPNWVMGWSNYIESAFTIHFNTEQTVTLNGYSYKLAATVIELKTIAANPKEKTFYVYLDYDGNKPYYRVVLTPLAESTSRALISIVKTNNEGIYDIQNYNVFTMNGVRVSTVRHGSVIPASIGQITNNGQLDNWME